MKFNFALFLGVAVGFSMFLSGCEKSGADKQLTPPLVTVSHPVQESVTAYLDLTGTAAASQSVDLVARIPGYLQSVNFQDGAFVESNQLLFVIEPEPYVEQLKIAQAQLLRAQSEYDRQQDLVKQNATSVANVEKWQSERDQAVAQVALAKLNLDYTHVTAPFSGRMGRHLIDPGNMVGVSGDTKLATLEELVPIYVYFNVNERECTLGCVRRGAEFVLVTDRQVYRIRNQQLPELPALANHRVNVEGTLDGDGIVVARMTAADYFP